MKKTRTNLKEETSEHLVDVLVDALDLTFFRIRSPDNYFHSSWGVEVDEAGSGLFESESFRAELETFSALAGKAKGKLPSDLDSQLWTCITESWDYPLMLGFVFGLRLAGLSSEDTKRMAKTWRPGNPGREGDAK